MMRYNDDIIDGDTWIHWLIACYSVDACMLIPIAIYLRANHIDAPSAELVWRNAIIIGILDVVILAGFALYRWTERTIVRRDIKHKELQGHIDGDVKKIRLHERDVWGRVDWSREILPPNIHR